MIGDVLLQCCKGNNSIPFSSLSTIVTTNLGLWTMCKSELNQLELGSAYLPGKKK